MFANEAPVLREPPACQTSRGGSEHGKAEKRWASKEERAVFARPSSGGCQGARAPLLAAACCLGRTGAATAARAGPARTVIALLCLRKLCGLCGCLNA